MKPFVSLLIPAGLVLASCAAASAQPVKFPIPAGTSIPKDVKIPSPSGKHYLSFQGDGNLVVKTKEEGFVWGLSQVAKNYAQAAKVEVLPGGLTVTDRTGKLVWKSQGKAGHSSLHLTSNGALQVIVMSAFSDDIVWSSDGNLTPPPPVIEVFKINPKATACAPAPGWAKCLQLPSPAITIMASAAVGQPALNAVATIYNEITARLRQPKYPVSKFDGFKVYITNGEPWPVLAKMSPVGTMWPDQTGPMSGNFLRGGANDQHLWIEEQMICKTGVKTRGPADKEARTFDQVVHEFAHSIDGKYIPDPLRDKTFVLPEYTPVELFAFRVQAWFGAPDRTMSKGEEGVLKDLFTSRVAFSCEGYRP